MGEIEKMYENTGIEKECNCTNYDSRCFQDCIKCEKYPPFTAEKQIELIKWLANTEHYIQSISMIYGGKKYYVENERYNGIASSFEEALAEVVNELWHSLTEEEKQQVKGILE